MRLRVKVSIFVKLKKLVTDLFGMVGSWKKNSKVFVWKKPKEKNIYWSRAKEEELSFDLNGDTYFAKLFEVEKHTEKKKRRRERVNEQQQEEQLEDEQLEEEELEEEELEEEPIEILSTNSSVNEEISPKKKCWNYVFMAIIGVLLISLGVTLFFLLSSSGKKFTHESEEIKNLFQQIDELKKNHQNEIQEYEDKLNKLKETTDKKIKELELQNKTFSETEINQKKKIDDLKNENTDLEKAKDYFKNINQNLKKQIDDLTNTKTPKLKILKMNLMD